MKRLLGDLRALGWWAPVRGIYEISTRLGLSGRLLRRGFAREGDHELKSPFRRSGAGGDPVDVEAADRILAGYVTVFGREIEVGSVPDWHSAGAGDPWPRIPWWKIRLRPDDGGDVKYVFELGRHRHLVTLARAAAEAQDADRYLAALESHLTSWFDQNRPEAGIHWFSNLEIALRAVSWLQVIALVGERLRDETRSEMSRHLYHSGRHLVWELPYTVSSMRNNHLIGDAVGLVAIGKSFPDDRKAQRWAAIGDRLLRRHVPEHVFSDGASIEDSLGYRSFVLETLAARVELGDAPGEVTEGVERTILHLERLGVGSGPVPHFGDWDGGRAFGNSDDAPPEGSLAVAQGVAPTENAESAGTEGDDVGGALARVQRGPWTIWLKAGSGESHGHADLSSVSILHGDTWVVGDPGNGSYNRSQEERDYFRTSIAHNVLRVSGQDQRVPHRRFRWRYQPLGTLGMPSDVGSYRMVWATHNAYARLEPPLNILRACLVGKTSVVVADWISDFAEWSLSLPLHPDVTYDAGGSALSHSLTLPGGVSLGLLSPNPVRNMRGSADPYDGWWADEYDSARPATRLEISGAGAGPVAWAVWSEEPPDISVDDGVLGIDGHRVQLRQENDGALILAAD